MTRVRTFSLLFFVAVFVPLVAYAQQAATKDEITSAFVGKTATLGGYSGNQSATVTFGADGGFNYVVVHDTGSAMFGTGSTAGGRYVISDGQVCVTYTAGRNDSQCYAIRKNKDG